MSQDGDTSQSQILRDWVSNVLSYCPGPNIETWYKFYYVIITVLACVSSTNDGDVIWLPGDGEHVVGALSAGRATFFGAGIRLANFEVDKVQPSNRVRHEKIFWKNILRI